MVKTYIYNKLIIPPLGHTTSNAPPLDARWKRPGLVRNKVARQAPAVREGSRLRSTAAAVTMATTAAAAAAVVTMATTAAAVVTIATTAALITMATSLLQPAAVGLALGLHVRLHVAAAHSQAAAQTARHGLPGARL